MSTSDDRIGMVHSRMSLASDHSQTTETEMISSLGYLDAVHSFQGSVDYSPAPGNISHLV